MHPKNTPDFGSRESYLPAPDLELPEPDSLRGPDSIQG